MVIPKKKSPNDPDYRSKFEQTVGEFLGEIAEHEPERIYFMQPEKKRFYLPDFKLTNGIYLEAKGKFVSGDRTKHLWLKEQHPDKRIILIFQNANVKLNKKSKTSYGDWCTKNNIEWYNWKDGIPAAILKSTENNNNNVRAKASLCSKGEQSDANKVNSGVTRGSSGSKRKPKPRASTVSSGSGAKRSPRKRG